MWRLSRLAEIWSTTRFASPAHAAYAERLMVDETRDGVRTMSLVLLLMLLTSLVLHDRLGFTRYHVYTAGALSLLCTHVFLAARGVKEVKTLHLLGLTLLTITGTGGLLAAHRAGTIDSALFSTAALLFMAIPMVPWGLREALLVTALVFGMFSASTWGTASRFSAEALWALQAFMLVAGAVAITLVGRAARVRKDDIVARYELECAQRKAERQSLQDPLTGAWNRRFLELEFHASAERARKCEEPLHLAIVDLDDFKELNDGYGHAAGDQMLCWIARGFGATLGEHGHVARVGGDEFILLFTDETPEETLADAAVATRRLVETEGGGAIPPLGISIGLATLAPSAPLTLDHAYRRADAALYRAKAAPQRGPGEVRVVRAEMHGASTRGSESTS